MFEINQENGTDFMEDEYIMSVDKCIQLYKTKPTFNTKKAYKYHPVYMFKPNEITVETKK